MFDHRVVFRSLTEERTVQCGYTEDGIQLDVAAGSNWTVADITDVAVGASPSAIKVNLEKVADDIGGYMVDHN